MGNKASEEVEKAGTVESGLASLKIAVKKSREVIEAHPLISIAVAFGLGIIFATLFVGRYPAYPRNAAVDVDVNGTLRLTPDTDTRVSNHKYA